MIVFPVNGANENKNDYNYNYNYNYEIIKCQDIQIGDTLVLINICIVPLLL